MTRHTKIKLTVAIAAFLLVAIFVVLNMGEVEVKFLLARVTMPLGILVLAIFVVGLFAGWVISSIGVIRQKRKSKSGSSKGGSSGSGST